MFYSENQLWQTERGDIQGDLIYVRSRCQCWSVVSPGSPAWPDWDVDSPLQKAPGLSMCCLHTSHTRFLLKLLSVKTWLPALASCRHTEESDMIILTTNSENLSSGGKQQMLLLKQSPPVNRAGGVCSWNNFKQINSLMTMCGCDVFTFTRFLHWSLTLLHLKRWTLTVPCVAAVSTDVGWFSDTPVWALMSYLLFSFLY